MPVTRLSGVGPKQAEKLLRLKIKTVQDCLFHLPLRYQDRTRLVAIGDLQVGIEAVCIGQIQTTEVMYRGRRSMVCHISDSTGELRLRFFHFNQSQTAALREGQRIRCFGEIRRGSRCLEIVHPEYQLLGATEVPEVEERLTPIYPITEGLHQLSMRRIADRSIALLREYAVDELLPDAQTYCSLQEALETVHQPGAQVSAQALLEGTHPAVQRLALEELVAHRLSVQRGRVVFQQFTAPAIGAQGDLLKRLLGKLPFSPTGAQQRVIGEIARDLAQSKPMLRLIQRIFGTRNHWLTSVIRDNLPSQHH